MSGEKVYWAGRSPSNDLRSSDGSVSVRAGGPTILTTRGGLYAGCRRPASTKFWTSHMNAATRLGKPKHSKLRRPTVAVEKSRTYLETGHNFWRAAPNKNGSCAVKRCVSDVEIRAPRFKSASGCRQASGAKGSIESWEQ
jgi:hypothetical protein